MLIDLFRVELFDYEEKDSLERKNHPYNCVYCIAFCAQKSFPFLEGFIVPSHQKYYMVTDRILAVLIQKTAWLSESLWKPLICSVRFYSWEQNAAKGLKKKKITFPFPIHTHVGHQEVFDSILYIYMYIQREKKKVLIKIKLMDS